jgi:hypothetical protein
MAKTIKESREARVAYREDQRVIWIEIRDNRHRLSKRVWPDFWLAKVALNAGLIDWGSWIRGRGSEIEKSK